MKKILLAISAVALLFATSCKKENVNPAIDVPEGSFLATIDNGAVPQNAPRVTDGMGTMTTIDANNFVIWEDNDEISINGQTYITTKGQTTAVFSPKDQTKQATGSMFHAFYPASIAGTGAAGTLPEDQFYESGNASYLPMYACSTNNQLTFHNICAVLKITIPSFLDDAEFIIVSSDQYMNGAFTVDANYKAVMTETSTNRSKKWVFIRSSEGSFSENDVVYIAVPAQAYSNLKITFLNNGDDTMWEKTLATCTLEVNKIYNVNITEMPDPYLLPGLFSVSQTQQVKFTKGNLMGTASNYSFASSQLSLGDVFNWTTDWQSPVTVLGKEFRLLTNDEWNYLINTRTMTPTTTPRCQIVSIGGEYALAIYPDVYTGTVADTYTTDEWQTAEQNGAVALYRKSSSPYMSWVRVTGGYWSATPDENAYFAKCLTFNQDVGDITDPSIGVGSDLRTASYPIRLVKNY